MHSKKKLAKKRMTTTSKRQVHIEYSLEVDEPIIEWEVTAHEIDDFHNVIVGQVVLKKEYIGREVEVIENLTKKYGLDAIKIYSSFESSEVTGKRDFQKLKADKEGYYAPYDEDHLVEYTYPLGEKPISKIVEKLNLFKS